MVKNSLQINKRNLRFRIRSKASKEQLDLGKLEAKEIVEFMNPKFRIQSKAQREQLDLKKLKVNLTKNS